MEYHLREDSHAAASGQVGWGGWFGRLVVGENRWEISIAVVRWGGCHVVVIDVVDWRRRIVLGGVSWQELLRGGGSGLLDIHVVYAKGHQGCRGVVVGLVW